MVQHFTQDWNDMVKLAVVLGTLAAAIGGALIARYILFRVLHRLTLRKSSVLGLSLVKHGQRPTKWIFPLLAVLVVLPGLPLPADVMSALEHATGLGLIAAVAWLAIVAVDIAADVIAERYRIDVADNLTARRVQTQFQMIQRVLVVLVGTVALAVMLMTFPVIKHIGVSLLASAGLATLVVGMAMNATLSNLIAGVQIAFSQPFRLGDAVVVEGEWGWIEEVSMMFVVVRIWDLRRMVLPLSYFLTHPFQNWTRTNADILGNTIFYVDYSVPMDELRTELRRICESTKLWKGQVCVLQVTDSTEHTMQLRALMDARNSSDSWDLRCLVREGLIVYLRKNYPESLPRFRGEIGRGASVQTEATAGPTEPMNLQAEQTAVAAPTVGPEAPTKT
jgi:small-conductance mechanosensitive channel